MAVQQNRPPKDVDPITDNKAQTVYVTGRSLGAGYALVLIIMLFAWMADIPSFGNSLANVIIICLAVANLLIGLYGGLTLYGDRDGLRSNRYHWYIAICSIFSIFSLPIIIHLTGGLFRSLYSGFHGMLFSTLVLVTSRWIGDASPPRARLVLRICFGVVALLIAASALVSPICSGDAVWVSVRATTRLATDLRSVSGLGVGGTCPALALESGSLPLLGSFLVVEPNCHPGSAAPDESTVMSALKKVGVQGTAARQIADAAPALLAASSVDRRGLWQALVYRLLGAAVVVLGVLAVLVIDYRRPRASGGGEKSA